MTIFIAISSGGSYPASTGSNVNIEFDGSTPIVLSAHTQESNPGDGNLVDAANCTWTVLDVPEGSTFNSAWFDGAGGDLVDVNKLPSSGTFIPDKEGTWFFRCTNDSASTVDEVVVGVRHQRTHIRVPAAGETTEANDTRGWAEDRNNDLDLFDDLTTSGGIQLCRFEHTSSVSAGTLVEFMGSAHDINPTSGSTEFVPTVRPASNTNPGVGKFLGVIKGKKDGTTTSIANGSLVWVSRSGMVEGASGALDLSAASGWAPGDNIYVGATAGAPAKSTEVDTATATLAGFVIRAENPGAMVVSPAHFNNIITQKSNSTDRDQQFVEVELFEAPVSAHNAFNVATDSSSANFGFVPFGGSSNAPLDFPGFRFRKSADATGDKLLTSFALDDRCIREGTSGGTVSNFMEQPLVVEVHGYCEDNQASSTTTPTFDGTLVFNFKDLIAISIDPDNADAFKSTIEYKFTINDANTKFGNVNDGKRSFKFKDGLTVTPNAYGQAHIPQPLDTAAGFALSEYGSPYTGIFSNNSVNSLLLGGAYSTADATFESPPVSVDVNLDRSDTQAYHVIVEKIVLKALYPVKSRAKRLSFYEKQIPAAALVDTSRTFNRETNDGVLDYSASTLAGLHVANVLVSDNAGNDLDDLNAVTVSANLRGETAGTFCGFLPFDSRIRKLLTDSNYSSQSRDLRFRVVSKYKSTVDSPGAIKLRLYTRGEAVGGESSSLALTSDYTQLVDVSVSATASVAETEPSSGANDVYRTIVHDFSLAGSNYDPDLSGIRFRLERVANSGQTYKTVDNLADASTGEEVFCASIVCLSEASLDIAKDRANIFEEHILLDRQIDYNDGALNLTNWADTGSDVCGFKFTKGGSETLVVPVFLDDRYNEQSPVAVSLIGTVGGTTSSATTSAGSTPGGQVSMLLQAAMSYAGDLVPSSFSTVGIVNIDTSTALTGSNLIRTIRHDFKIPYTMIAQSSGIVDDNLSIPTKNRRGRLYLKLTRTDTTGPNTYLASSLSATASVDKLPNADPYVNISESTQYPLLVPGAFRHDQQRDILTTAYRHNWQFGVSGEVGSDLREILDGGTSVLEPGNSLALVPSTFVGNTPPSAYGVISTVNGTDFLGVEFIGKHIPFSMVITAIHGYMGSIDVGNVNTVYNKALLPTDAFIKLDIASTSPSASDPLVGEGAQRIYTGTSFPGILGFPMRIYPNSHGCFRYVGNDLSDEADRHKNYPLPRIFLPADYQGSRHLSLVAVLHSTKDSSNNISTTTAGSITAGDTSLTVSDASALPPTGTLLINGTDRVTYDSIDRTTKVVTLNRETPITNDRSSGTPVLNDRPSQIIAPVVDLNIEVAFLPNTHDGDLIY